ncbi:hypothetical protein C900_01240 [Fulvivirga imtechensis AK7]|uniref:Uncharacterized protein n=1 Tax=Fulvivirga imtechensis AK7 TaxID=1237149 RepID=L8JU77_9BACT|nr:hypothetical protein [Fulvivirga imtechensis]ELR72566.1 hypothetical protein C900_01240 [Fulvivirga imtechensis AK7]
MALAILKLNSKEIDKYTFEADIGTNNWYEYRLGKAKRKHRGMELVDEVIRQSTMLKAPVTDNKSFETSFTWSAPAAMFDRSTRFIQLFSYKDRNKTSPAISEVLTVAPVMADLNDDFKLPKMMTMPHKIYGTQSVAVRNAPFRLKENKMSEAFFFNALLGAIPGLLTNALPMLGKLLPGLQSTAPEVTKISDTAGKLLPELIKIIPQDVKPGAEGARQVLQNISPETIKAILEIIQGQLGKTNGTNGHSTAKSLKKYSHDFAINPATLMQLAPLLEKVLSPETIKAIGDNPVKLFKAVSDSALKFQKMELEHLEKINPGVDDAGFDKIVQGMAYRRTRYSKAKIAPALLAALPALMPVLEKVLSPDMIKAIGDQPVKLFNAIADAGLKHTKQELDHLEKINPGVDDPAFDNIVNSMNVKTAVTIDSTFSNALTIKFLNAQAISIAGKDKIVYDKRQKITFPVQLNSGKTKPGKVNGLKNIPKGIFQLIVQDGNSMEVLLEKKYKIKDVPVGAVIGDIVLTTDEVKMLPSNRDLKVELTFNWKGDKKNYGTFMNHYIMFSDGYVFQRTGNTSVTHFALNDVNVYRNYWHKVWEGGPASHERWKVDFECKYYYDINEEDANIKKLETKKRKISDTADDKEGDSYRRKIRARIKSGMEVSVEAYNELLKLQQLPSLSEEQLSAFSGEEFIKEAGLVGRVSVDFRGRKGETSALWTYPEGNIQSYILGKVVATDASGMVTELQEEEVQFPRFSSVHFIGTQSE